MNKAPKYGIFLLMLCYGFASTMLSPLISDLINKFSLNNTQGSLFGSAMNAGGVIAIIILIFLADRVNKTITMIIEFALFAAGIFAAGFANSFVFLSILMLFTGFGGRTVDAVANAVVSDRFPEKAGSDISLMHSLLGVGALLSPVIGNLLKRVSWIGVIGTIRIFGIISIVIYLIYLLTEVIFRKSANIFTSNKKCDKNHDRIYKDSEFWTVCIINFLYTGYQSIIIYWAQVYMDKQLNAPSIVSAITVSFFWVGIVISRYAASRFANESNGIPAVAYGSLAGGIILAVSVASGNPYFFVAAAFISGVTAGMVMPLTIGRMCIKYPLSSGRISSVIFLFATASPMICPLAAGFTADLFDHSFSMMTASVLLLLIFFTCLVEYGKEFKNKHFAVSDK